MWVGVITRTLRLSFQIYYMLNWSTGDPPKRRLFKSVSLPSSHMSIGSFIGLFCLRVSHYSLIFQKVCVTFLMQHIISGQLFRIIVKMQQLRPLGFKKNLKQQRRRHCQPFSLKKNLSKNPAKFPNLEGPLCPSRAIHCCCSRTNKIEVRKNILYFKVFSSVCHLSWEKKCAMRDGWML